MTLPENSRALVFSGQSGRMELCEIPIPPIRENEALVRVEACTLCGSDLHSIHGRRKVPVPTILGHEILGTLVHMGNRFPIHDLQGETVRIGDRIVWSIVAHCGSCFYCNRGLEQKCENACKYGHMSFDSGYVLSGGLAEYCVLAKGTSVLRIEDDLSPSLVTPASCATATVMAAMSELPSPSVQDSRIAILGAGMLGLTACAIAKDRGWKHIEIIDSFLGKAQIAVKFGATKAWTAEEWLQRQQEGSCYGYDGILEFSGAQSMMEPAIESLRIGGHLVLIGAVFPVPPISLLPEQIIRRQLSIRGYHNYRPQHLLEAVQFLKSSRNDFPFSELVSTWYSLSEISLQAVAGFPSSEVRIGVSPQL